MSSPRRISSATVWVARRRAGTPTAEAADAARSQGVRHVEEPTTTPSQES